MNGQPNVLYSSPLSDQVSQGSTGQLELTNGAKQPTQQQQYLVQSQQNYIQAFPVTNIQQQSVYNSQPNQVFAVKQSDVKEQPAVNSANSRHILIQQDLLVQMQQHYESQIQALKAELDSLKNRNSAKSNRSHIVKTYCEKIEGREFACQNCVYKTKSEASLIIHNTNHLVNQKYLHLPTTVFKVVKSGETVHTFLYPCGECRGGQFTHTDLYLHIYQNHTGEHPFHCAQCDLFFMHYELLEDHQRSEHMKQQGATKRKLRTGEENEGNGQLYYYSVVKCSKPFSSLSSTLDSRAESQQPPVTFPYSGKRGRGRATRSFTSESHSVEANITYRCHYEACIFSADSKDRLDFHLYAHRSSRFKCPHCPYVSNVLNDIKRHCIRAHPGEGSMFTCPNCSLFHTNCDRTFREHIRGVHFDKSLDDKSLTLYIEEMFLNTTPLDESDTS